MYFSEYTVLARCTKLLKTLLIILGFMHELCPFDSYCLLIVFLVIIMSRKCFFKLNCIFLIYKESECFWDNFVIQGFHYLLTHSSFCDELSDSTTHYSEKSLDYFNIKKGCQAHYSETSLDYFNKKRLSYIKVPLIYVYT